MLYDCSNCGAYCCTYAHIPATKADIRRLAKHFGIPEKKAEKKFTKSDGEKGRVMRHRFDEIYESACMFLDQGTRRCTVHPSRPKICREFPGTARCHYYDFLQKERDLQDDPHMLVAAYPVDP